MELSVLTHRGKRCLGGDRASALPGCSCNCIFLHALRGQSCCGGTANSGAGGASRTPSHCTHAAPCAQGHADREPLQGQTGTRRAACWHLPSFVAHHPGAACCCQCKDRAVHVGIRLYGAGKLDEQRGRCRPRCSGISAGLAAECLAASHRRRAPRAHARCTEAPAAQTHHLLMTGTHAACEHHHVGTRIA